jgi:hypothetical protein
MLAKELPMLEMASKMAGEMLLMLRKMLESGSPRWTVDF